MQQPHAGKWLCLLTVGTLVAVGCQGPTLYRPSDGPPAFPDRPGAGWALRSACDLPRGQLHRIQAGYRPGRSGEVQFVAEQPAYFGEHSHSGPWPYLQRVPLLLLGHDHVPAGRRVSRPVTLADVAPTLARLLRFELAPAGGTSLREAVIPRAELPRVVVAVVWDGGGRNVLAEHPQAWPALRRSIPQGTWFSNATVGSSPSVSPAIHSTLGTGLPPADHGVVDMVFRRSGRMVGVTEDPGFLVAPTLADLYDRAQGNRPLVGLIGHELTLGILGHGAAFPQADRDLLLVESERGWETAPGGARFFRFPDYARDLPGLTPAMQRLDRRDGVAEGAWRGEPLDELDPSTTPAFADYQTQTIAEIIRREEIGADRVPDLLFVNYNQINEVGHRWSMNSPQMADAVRSSDRALEDLVRLLDREVGRGRWVVALTADHGSTPDASISGGFVIDSRELVEDLSRRFDGDGDRRRAIQTVRVTQLWVDRRELQEKGFEISDVAWFLETYTRGENRADPHRLSPSQRGHPVFRAAFPSGLLRELPCLPEQ